MKRYYLFALPFLTLSAFAAVFPQNYHATTSSLAAGRWVKIKIDETGVYRLTYDRLREMGFENPEAVSVYGRGLVPSPDQFMTADGDVLVDSDVKPVPVMAAGDAIYFYGVGSGWMTHVEATADVPDHFERLNKPVYSRYAYYLLSDAGVRTDMTRAEMPDSTIVPSDGPGVSYVINDLDLEHGFKNSGQIYLGEQYTKIGDKLTWTGTAPCSVASGTAVVQGAAYADDTSGPTSSQAGDVLKFSALGTVTSATLPQSDAGSWTNLIPSTITGTLTNGNYTIQSWVDGSRTLGSAALDYWLLSYPCRLAESIELGRPVVAPLNSDEWARIDVSEGVVGWNVADPTAPVILPSGTGENGNYIAIPGSDSASPRPVLFNPDETPEPAMVGTVRNTDLHSQAAEGADLLIITVPMLRAQAEKLADLHVRYDGMKCIVAEVSDIYNEYNSGQPSVMAYKSLIKQIYKANGDRHLDVLLLGPLKGEMLGINTTYDIDSSECIIAYQADTFPQKGDCHNINEYLGMMDDVITVRPEYATVQVGVGILPCMAVEEAERIISKIERYITRSNYELVANRMVGIGGSGDLQSHTKQAVELQGYINSFYQNGLIYTPHMSEAFEASGQTERFADYINNGVSVISYMGHGGAASFDRMPMMSTGSQLMLHNNVLPFMCFGMCDATGPDRMIRGLGEQLILTHEDGLIGGIMSTRTAYSNQNGSMLRLFMQALAPKLKNPTDKVLPAEQLRAKTVGQVYAEARTSLRTLHENTFTLMCDPALRLVTPVFRMKMVEEVSPILPIGSPTKLTGEVRSNCDNVMTGFNGNCVLHIMAPSRTILCPTLVSGQSIADNQKAAITYAHQVEATFFGTVKDGIWEVIIDPAETQFLNENSTLALQLSAYDPAMRVAASGVIQASFQKLSETSGVADENVPVIETLEYDPSGREIRYVVSDDRGLSLGNDYFAEGLTIEIDGAPYQRLANNYEISVDERFTISGSIPAEHLGTGVHTLVLTASDNAGNTESRSLEFTVGGAGPDRQLVASAETTHPPRTFTLDRYSKGRLMIADHSGTIVAWRDIDGSQIDFDLCDNAGHRLTQGVYRAWVITDGPDFGYSSQVKFGILAPLQRQ